MKKSFVILSIILSAMILVCLLTSCRKCKNCTYSQNGTVIIGGEYCGREIQEVEDHGYVCH